MDLAQRISRLRPEQRKLLELKIKKNDIDIYQIPVTQEYRKNYDRFPLSAEQKTWWAVGPIDPYDPSYDVTAPVILEGNLNIEVLERSINEVVKRYEILRTLFAVDDDKPVQVILPSLTLRLERIDFKGIPGDKQEKNIRQLTGDNSLYQFDLNRVPLVKILLIELSENKYLLITVMHHIISDLLSLGIFLKEVAWFYTTFSQAKWKSPGFDLPLPPFQYVDYACWQQHWFRESILGIETRKKQEVFWLEMFRGEIPVLNLPNDYPRPAQKSCKGAHEFFTVKGEKIRALKELTLKENTTLYVLVLSIFYVFLAKISGQEDIVVGTLVNTRQNPSLNNMIGLFVKKLPLRSYPQGNKTFRDFLREMNIKVLNMYKNQDYPYEKLLNKTLKKPDISRSPFFDVLLNFIYIDIGETEMSGLKLKPYTLKTKRVGYDFELICEGTYKELFFKLSYCTTLFKEETIKKFISYFLGIIEEVIKNPGVKISGIDMVS